MAIYTIYNASEDFVFIFCYTNHVQTVFVSILNRALLTIQAFQRTYRFQFSLFDDFMRVFRKKRNIAVTLFLS